MLELRLAGQQRVTSLAHLPVAFQDQGIWELAWVVLATTLLAPFGEASPDRRGDSQGFRMDIAPSTLAAMERWRKRLTPWAMIEVFPAWRVRRLHSPGGAGPGRNRRCALCARRADAGDGGDGCLARRACVMGGDRAAASDPGADGRRDADRVRRVAGGSAGQCRARHVRVAMRRSGSASPTASPVAGRCFSRPPPCISQPTCIPVLTLIRFGKRAPQHDPRRGRGADPGQDVAARAPGVRGQHHGARP